MSIVGLNFVFHVEISFSLSLSTNAVDFLSHIARGECD